MADDLTSDGGAVLYTFTVERSSGALGGYTARCHEVPDLRATSPYQYDAVMRCSELVRELAQSTLSHAAARRA